MKMLQVVQIELHAPVVLWNQEQFGIHSALLCRTFLKACCYSFGRKLKHSLYSAVFFYFYFSILSLHHGNTLFLNMAFYFWTGVQEEIKICDSQFPNLGEMCSGFEFVSGYNIYLLSNLFNHVLGLWEICFYLVYTADILSVFRCLGLCVCV